MFIDRVRRGIIVCVAVALFAGALSAPAFPVTWTNHVDASLINEIVVRDGLFYMATFGGILIYDPATGDFEQYSNSDGLTSNAITCLAIEEDGDIYCGTADIGVAKVRITNGQLTLRRSLSQQIDGLAGNRINSIATWNNDIVYGSTPGAGVIRNDFAAAPIFERDGLPGPDVFDVMPFGNAVWMATAGGVATLNTVGIVQTVAGSPTQAMVMGNDGTNVYVGTNTGVRRFDPGSSSWTDIGPATERIRSLFWDGSTLWAAAARNFMSYSGTGTAWTITSANIVQQNYSFGSATTNLETKGLAVFPGGDVYIGSAHPTDLRGPNIIRYNAGVFSNPKPNAPGANDVRRLDIDIDGSLWASFASFYVGKLMPDGNWLNYNTSIPGIQLPTNGFTNIAFLCDSGGHKWFSSLSLPLGTHRPLDELDDGRDANYANDVWVRHAEGSGGGEGYGTLRPQRAAEDPRGNRWFMSDDFGASEGWEGINILSQDKTAWFQMNPGKEPRMIDNNVIDVAFGSFETYVAFLSNGVYRWRHFGYDWSALTNFASDTWDAFLPVGELPAGAFISRLQLRSDGLVWVASDAGLFYSDTLGGEPGSISTYVGISPGIVSPKVRDIVLDHDENLWVATDLGLNRIARDDNNDIQTFLTPASFAVLSGLRYPLEVISPLAHADCRSLAIHPTEDVLYIGTFGGISVYDFSAPAATETDLSKVYVYPNPVYASKGHVALKIANLTGPVSIEIYNLEGELVDSRTVAIDGDVAWDLTTRDGFNAGSGRYIVRIVGEHGSVQRPFALIR